ncbi:DEAD/DEAH box helicase [Gleimia sp. 6138-11-ORH1]|uniref:DEAD/DEAH box helicase n=1 Tax=Gleimia sp. 6138-11-ORH1 TaxID=2973937 RepID=UPI002169C71C|nr:DEAD/DEAH box helicase [Gleimia sp. 6138-11-ORH1]MCS4484400.1 DEAD/DEAH box helicase [Gleimia sp. 6138-11-ORH1]
MQFSDYEMDTMTTFADLNLPEKVLSAITEMGFESPTPIQEQSIPYLLEGRDIVGIAQTGTGKTAAFGLPMLAHIDPALHAVQAIILAPTRELAMQSATAIEAFSAHLSKLKVVTVYGGAPYTTQIKGLKSGAQIVVGTPGRVIDLIEKGALKLNNVAMLVLDEADEMLRMGFAEDVETIVAAMPESGKRITALFSATMPDFIKRVADQYLTDPVRIEVARQSSTVENIQQTYAVVPFKHKLGALGRVLATRDEDAAIVFVRTRVDADEVAVDMATRGFTAAAISGDVSQNERERIVSRLRDGSLDVLVATDVAARGLDVERIGLVINFDVPRETEAYVHRVGRTGRAGRQGRSLTFFTPKEQFRLRQIEKLTGTKMEEIVIPSPREVSEFRARRLLATMPQRVELGRLELYYDLLHEIRHTTDIEIEDIAAALLAFAIGDKGPQPEERRGKGKIRHEEEVDAEGNFVAASFEAGRDGGKKSRLKSTKPSSAPRISSGFSRRYRVEVGKRDGVKPGAIVGAITGEGGVAGSDLGRIEIFPTFSLVEVSGELSEKATSRISKAFVSGRQLRIKEDTGPAERGASDEKAGRSGGRQGWSDRGRGGFKGRDRKRGGSGRSDRKGFSAGKKRK